MISHLRIFVCDNLSEQTEETIIRWQFDYVSRTDKHCVIKLNVPYINSIFTIINQSKLVGIFQIYFLF